MDTALSLQILSKAGVGRPKLKSSSARPTKGVPIMKTLSRLILSIVTAGGAAAALTTQAGATLQFSVGSGESSYTCIDNSSCDSNPAAGMISIPEISFAGITGTNVTVTATGDSLNFTVGSLTNDSGGTLFANFAVSDSGFGDPIRFKTFFTTTWRDAAGSSIDVAWYADPQNAPGANTPTDTPGSQFDSFGADTPGGSDTASHSGAGALDISAPFSLSVGGSIELASGGTESASESVTVGVPEPSTWAMMLLGFAGLGFAGYRARKGTAAVA